MPQRPSQEPQGTGEGQPPEPLPDDLARKALSGDPEAEAVVEDKWEQAKAMEGEAPTG